MVYCQRVARTPPTAFTVRVDGTEKRPLLVIKSSSTRYSSEGAKIAYLEEPESEGVRVVIAVRHGRVLATVPLHAVRAAP